MKHKLLYLLLLLMVCAAGCSKSQVAPTTQLSVPVGNFTGQFARFHITVATKKSDTLYASLKLELDASGNYAVTGDTSINHGGSFGTYTLGVVDALVFTDKTLPATGTPAKQHLSGSYIYSYNNGILELAKNSGDTLNYQYYFTKN